MIAGAAYAAAYLFGVGILSYDPAGDFAQSAKAPYVPYLRVVMEGPIGEAPMLLWIPTKHLALDINLSAALFTVVTALLVGGNVAMLAYIFNVGRVGCGKEMGLCGVSMAPPMFTIFSCCAGGPLLALIGATAFTALAAYSQLFMAGSIALLTASLLVIAKRVGTAAQRGQAGRIG